MTKNNAAQVFGVGATAGTVAVISSGALAASATAVTISTFFGAELGTAGFVGTLAGQATDLGLTVLISNPDPAATQQGIKNLQCPVKK